MSILGGRGILAAKDAKSAKGMGKGEKGREGWNLGDGAPRAKRGSEADGAGVDRGVHASAQDLPKGWLKD